jgi:predicted transcriptional regulator
MKTTIEIPDALFAEVKAVAARRRTTMKAMLEHALRREIATMQILQPDSGIELNNSGFPVLKNRTAGQVTSQMVYDLMDEQDG